MRSRRSGVLVGSLGVAVLGALAACSSSPTPSAPPSAPVPSASLEVPTPTHSLAAGAHWRGVPASFGEPDVVGSAGVGWTPDDGLLYVVLWGSSSCPPVAMSPTTRTADGAVAVVTDERRYAGKICTADMVPSTTVVALPDGSRPGAAVPVLVDGRGPVTLPAAADDPGPVWVDAE
ncbi:hypothetical protein [Luteimicrobium sp. DT211]|uniref:hypothetical protein n=1 Tax=Luteimicrobium sp. DT211 TaxID=3393412 RepID=UPI003CEF7648